MFPATNLIFLTFAAAYAYPRGIRHLVTGVAQTDYSGYPDCRQGTISALEQAISAGMDCDFHPAHPTDAQIQSRHGAYGA